MANPSTGTAADSMLSSEAAAVGVQIGQTILNRYTVRRLLGVGAMGHVLEVHDSKTGEDAAVKCVPQECAGSEAHMQSIKRNYELVKGLSHPHIAALKSLERDTVSAQYYLVMELVRGVDLSDWLMEQRAANQAVSIQTVLGIAEQIAVALDYAHSCPVSDGKQSPQRFGILHRDLKPANVMVERSLDYRPGVPYVKLVDFGLAAQIQASLYDVSLNTKNKLAGTPVYMAPEQWEGRTLTRGVDQWALAVMIYEMLCGARPFDGPTESAIMQNVKLGNPIKPSALSSAQWAALKVAFNPDRKSRYRSCVALVKALAEADAKTCDSIGAIEPTMPDEFAGLPPEAFNNIQAGSLQPVDSTRAILLTLVKWFSVTAIILVIGLAAYLIFASKTTPAKPETPAVAVADEHAKYKAHKLLTSALEQVTDPKKKRTWAATKAALEDPIANPLNADHPGLETARKLLKTANIELAKAPEFERKLEAAKRALEDKKYEEALQGLEGARAAWPESGRFDELYQYMKTARDAIAAEHLAQNQKTLNEAWAKFGTPSASNTAWAEIVRVLEPALELDGNGSNPNFNAAVELVNRAKLELAFEKSMKRGKALMDAERYDDAAALFKDLQTKTTDPAKLDQLKASIATVDIKANLYKSTIVKEAEGR